MLNRRRFLKSLVVAASTPVASCASAKAAIESLKPDPDQLLDLPEGFEKTVISRTGSVMSDGLRVPGAHDGMGAFAGADGRVILVCNHEMRPGYYDHDAFGTGFAELPESVKERVYDWGGSETPGGGGTTTTIYDPATRTVERQFLSLAGTELNCAGGVTPWRSWLTCEECFEDVGTSYATGRRVIREERHGYVFEVPADSEGLVEPVPLRAMGRFEHEAAAVHEPSGIVYMTEDRYHSLFYRFLPAVPGQLAEGGQLQALAIAGKPSSRTHNWEIEPDITVDDRLPVTWIDLDDPEPFKDKLREWGAAMGAATFARGEGLCNAGNEFAFTCTAGGAARLGQVFAYTPSPYEGTDRESEQPGSLRLITEATEDSLLRNCDNLTMAPWGDLIVCEDTAGHCGLIGVRPDGTLYQLADNVYSDSELAGVCFSPDGQPMFVNIQVPGITLAITGPWPTS